MTRKLREVFGAFRILRQRAREEGKPGIVVWANAGEKAAVQVQTVVRDGSYTAEQQALTLERELREIVADGVVSRDEIGRLQIMPDRIHRVAERCHDVGEVVL